MTFNEQYDAARFSETLDNTVDYLAELRYIDDALAYLKAQPEADPAEGRTQWVVFTLGETHPFEFAILRMEDDADFVQEAEARLEFLAGAASGALAGEVASLWAVASPLTSVSGYEFMAIVDQLYRVHDSLEADVDQNFEDLRGDLGSWEGESASTFRGKFLAPFADEMHAHHLTGLTDLMKLVAGAKIINDSAQHSLLNAALAWREATEEQLRDRAAAHGAGVASPEALKKFISIGTGIGNLLSVMLSVAHPPAAAVIGTVSQIAAFAEYRIPDSASDEGDDVKGSTYEELVSAFQDHFAAIERNAVLAFAGTDEQHLSGISHKLGTQLRNWRAGNQLVPLRALIPQADPERFNHRSSSRG